MNGIELAMALAVGVGLAAAAGFRVFVPMLALALAARADLVPLAENLQWLATTPALLALATATLLEIGGYYVPWLDNALDTLATPVAVIAGTLLTASVLTDVDPLLRWALGLIAGGGTAATVQLSSVAVRAASTLTTAGLGNPAVSTVEAGAATLMAVLAIFVPVVAVLVLGALLVVMWRVARRRGRRRWPRRREEHERGTKQGE